ncbi:13640_t:CDS:2, partial [Funneliformis geosporum]
MIPPSFSQIIRKIYEEFVVNFIEKVTSRILGSLNNSWNNPAFSSNFAKSQNEGTYVTNVIVPAIQVTLK